MSQPPIWAGQYVGIPFVDLGRDRRGCDCWGLVRLVLADRAGIALPCWGTTYLSEASLDSVGALVEAERVGGDWTKIEPGDEQPFDLVEMAMPWRSPTGWVFAPLHVGVVVDPGWLLHVERATATVLARYNTDQSVRRRVLGFWRFRSQEPGPRSQDDA